MQDITPDQKDLLIAELQASNKELTERCEFLARLVLDLQETVVKLKEEIDRLKGQKSRPKIPPSTLQNNDKGKGPGNKGTKNRTSVAPSRFIKELIV